MIPLLGHWAFLWIRRTCGLVGAKGHKCSLLKTSLPKHGRAWNNKFLVTHLGADKCCFTFAYCVCNGRIECELVCMFLLLVLTTLMLLQKKNIYRSHSPFFWSRINGVMLINLVLDNATLSCHIRCLSSSQSGANQRNSQDIAIYKHRHTVYVKHI
jgi:hypothetical protein